MNNITILGNLGKDPELRTVGENKVAKFSVAVKSFSKRGDGPTQESVDWFSVVAWNKQAESCSEYLSKGSQVVVEGRIATGKYKKDDGTEVYTWDLVASRVHFVGPKTEKKEEKKKDDDLSDIPF